MFHQQHRQNIWLMSGIYLKSALVNLPTRLYRLGLHLWQMLRIRRWLNRKDYHPNGTTALLGFRVVAWLVRLFTKTLDVLGLGELICWLLQISTPHSRPLSDFEQHEAQRVFKTNIPYHKIRIDEKSWIARLGADKAKSYHMGMGIGYTIHFTRHIKPQKGNRDMDWLIHEMVHILQMERVGIQYTIEALYAQATTGYGYGGAAALCSKPLKDFNREQQAAIVQDYYRYVLFNRPHPKHGHLPYEVYREKVAELLAGKM